MTFEQYLSRKRNPVRFKRARAKNPANIPADRFALDLNHHLNEVQEWINHGGSNRSEMLEAMLFFDEQFHGAYRAQPGTKLYRGQVGEHFDGDPRSYSTEVKVAEDFACGLHWSFSAPIIIERSVCHACADAAAFKLTLDLEKLLEKYGEHKYGWEREVVILNTMPRGATVTVMEVQCT